jgi:hypothetical protein
MDGSCPYQSQNLDPTTVYMMERLPTETMLEVLRHSDKSTIYSIAIVSSKYCAIAQPLIFRRICVDQMEYQRFVLFIEQMENRNRLALMIKTLILCSPFTEELLTRLFAVVSNLEELLIEFDVAQTLLFPHYFPNLQRLRLASSDKRVIGDLVANFIPRHESLNDLEFCSVIRERSGDPGDLYMLPPAESTSSWVDRLVKYRGPRGLLPLLTKNSKMKCLASYDQLDEMTLRKLSRAVSRGLLSLHVGEPRNTHLMLSIPLLPSLFPYLQSIAWLKVHIIQTGLYTPTTVRSTYLGFTN